MAVAALMAGCKPSEKNYRLAYETAQKRERADLDEGVYELMQQAQLPPLVRVMGDSVRVERRTLEWYYTPIAVDSGRPVRPAPYNLAVALFKMSTNARAMADELAGQGYKARVFKSKNEYYVMEGIYSSLDSVAHASSAYTVANPSGCIGIPCPIAIQPLQ